MKDRLRVLLTHVYAWPEVRRGGERYLHELGAALAAEGHRVSIMSTAATPGRARIMDVPVRYLPRRRRLRRYGELSVEACFGYEVLARRALWPVDVWHAFGTADAAAASMLSQWRPGVRSVYTDLGNPERTWREGRPDTRLHERVVRDIDEYLCLSEFSNRHLRDNYGRTGRVIGGGVDMTRFHPAPSRTADPTLLFTSSVNEPRKNLPMLLSALAILRRRGSAVRLVICGPGDAGPVLADAPPEARDATDVLGIGEPDDLIRLSGEAWATVLPSEEEAFGLVLVESLACGTPVVALADGGGPAEIATPGVGFQATSRTAAALADACERALELAALGSQTVEACRSAAAAHDWRTGVLPKIVAAYRGVVF